MDYIEQTFSVEFNYKVFFTSDLFSSGNKLLLDFLQKSQVHFNIEGKKLTVMP